VMLGLRRGRLRLVVGSSSKRAREEVRLCRRLLLLRVRIGVRSRWRVLRILGRRRLLRLFLSLLLLLLSPLLLRLSLLLLLPLLFLPRRRLNRSLGR
jgi:hypothetical protein